jgi:hypothetical protein
MIPACDEWSIVNPWLFRFSFDIFHLFDASLKSLKSRHSRLSGSDRKERFVTFYELFNN